MKKILLFALPVMMFGITSCGNNHKTSDQNNQSDSVAGDSLGTEYSKCYQAVSGADSASLKMTESNGKVTGELNFNFSAKEDTHGTIKGLFKGDTLFVDYDFKQNEVAYKNPQVFLRKGDQLVQGYGELFTYLGTTTFKKNAKIDFEKGFVFKPSKCK